MITETIHTTGLEDSIESTRRDCKATSLESSEKQLDLANRLLRASQAEVKLLESEKVLAEQNYQAQIEVLSSQLTGERLAHELTIKNLHQVISNIECSRSWRLTAPLRRMVSFFSSNQS